MRPRRGAGGLTLVEVLAAMAVFAVIAGLATQLYLRTRRSMRRQTARAVAVSQQLDLLAMMERDARMATRSLYRLGPFRQDLHTLILEMPGPKRGAWVQYVVYRAEGGGPYALTRQTYGTAQGRDPLENEVVGEGLREVALGSEGAIVTVRWVRLHEGDPPIEMPMQTAVCMRNFR